MANPTQHVNGKKRTREVELLERARQNELLDESIINCEIAFKRFREETYQGLADDAKLNTELLRELVRKGNLRAITMFLDLMEKSLSM